jgi:hypothetical protein
MTFLWLVGAIYAIAISLARSEFGDIAMPYLVGELRQSDPLKLGRAVFGKEAHFYSSCVR